jgi:hypothetical protein
MITKVRQLPGESSKRFLAELSLNGKIKRIKFGAPGGSTYLDHGDKKKRENYWKRHMANPVEKYRIENLIPSAALLSAYLLWGESTDLSENVDMLNGAWLSHAT